MGHKDLHAKPFDEGTIAKLDIFEDYAKAWIPTFIVTQGISTICIFDFFAGTGFDKNGVAGSAIRILDKIREQSDLIARNRVKIVVHLNEYEPKKQKQKKFKLLQQACSEYLEDHGEVKQLVEVNLYNKDFNELFQSLLPTINKFPSLVYLDQNGIKFLSDKYLLELEKLKTTDFLYFVSSSYLLRFGNSDEFRKHLDIDLSEAKANPFKYIHRSIINALRKKLSVKSRLSLYPYSLKKSRNIHGIIFGASHPLAVDKFLKIAWKKDPMHGEANFDIEDEKSKRQGSLFTGHALNKIERFKKSVRQKVLSGEITNNFKLYEYTLKEGHIGSHAASCLKEMKKCGKITYEGCSPLVTYDNVCKNKKKIEYRVLNHEKV